MSENAAGTDELTGVVLAGGFSRRFGEADKALTRLGGTPLLARVVSRLGEVAESVVVNCRGDQREPFEAALATIEVPVRFAEDPATDRGPLFGFRVALDRVETERCALATCDAPFLDPRMLADLAGRLDGDPEAETEPEPEFAAVRTPDGRVQPTGAVYRTDPAAAACEDLLDADERRLSALFDRLDCRTVPAEQVAGDADRSFFDVDTPADRERAAELLAEFETAESETVESEIAESETASSRTAQTRVVALGTFDVLHPGHVHYLREAAAMGDELHVVVANGDRVSHKDPVLPDDQRVRMVEALEPVAAAHPGHPSDISEPIRRIDPDVLVLGGDQHHDEETVASMLADWGVDCEVRRASLADPDGEECYSSSAIVRRILDREGPTPSPRVSD